MQREACHWIIVIDTLTGHSLVSRDEHQAEQQRLSRETGHRLCFKAAQRFPRNPADDENEPPTYRFCFGFLGWDWWNQISQIGVISRFLTRVSLQIGSVTVGTINITTAQRMANEIHTDENASPAILLRGRTAQCELTLKAKVFRANSQRRQLRAGTYAAIHWCC